jgi:hypothetical protein
VKLDHKVKVQGSNIPLFCLDTRKHKGTTSEGTQNSTLPLIEENVSHQAHIIFEIDMLSPWQGLGENFFHLLINRNIMKLNHPTLNPVSNEMILDLNVLRPIMKHWILREFDTTMIITVNECRRQLLTK